MVAIKCSFCGKAQEQVKKVIAGPGVWICDECIDLCNDIIAGELAECEDQEVQPSGLWSVQVRVQTDQLDLRKRIVDDITYWGRHAVSIDVCNDIIAGEWVEPDQEPQTCELRTIEVRVEAEQSLRKRILDDITSWGRQAVSVESKEEHPSGVRIRRTEKRSADGQESE